MRRAVAAALLAMLVIAAPAAAQEVADPVLRIDSIDKSSYPDVTITITVPTEMNGLDLSPENFFISENERSVSIQVEQLAAEELQVALLMDTSGSMRGAPINSAKDAVTGFVEAMPPDVELALVGFGDTAELLVPSTTDQGAILAGIDGLAAGGETALYDGLVAAVDSFAGTSGTRRTLVLLTDGADTISETGLDDALVALIGSNAKLLIIELDSPESDRITLERLEAAAGGTLVGATDPDALAGIYAEVASDLINQYALSFSSLAEGPTQLLVAVRTEEMVAQSAAAIRFPVAAVIEEPPPTTTVSPATTIAARREIAAAPVVFDVPFFATTGGLMIGAAAVFLAATLALLLLMPARQRALATLGSIAGWVPDRSRSRFSELTSKATLFAEETVNRGKAEGWLQAKLDRAGLRLREGEFLLTVFAFVVVAAVGGYLFGDFLIALALGIMVVLGSLTILSALGTRRATAFRNQLPDSLQLISGSLRAGFGLNQAISAVAGEQKPPSNEEFARAQLEVHLGRDLEDALRSLAVRVQSEDMPWVAEAIEIHREIGGDVADLLDQIAATVRERERVRGQIKALSAEGKVSGIVLVALPFVIAGITFSVAPDYLGELTRTTVGQVMLLGGLGSLLIGIFWIRRIIRLEF